MKKKPAPAGPGEIKPELSISAIEALKAKGHSQSDIARMFGVTRQAVSWHKHTYGGALTPRETVNRTFPWQVIQLHTKASAYRRMRDHGEYMATGGKGMSYDKLSRLRSFYKKLREENLVLEYDPNLPPEPGVALHGGFAYRRRRKSDGDLLIRLNEHTNLSEEGRMVWRFPPKDP
jgi:hypothetical protein